MSLTLVERTRGWMSAPAPDDSVARARRAFGMIWLLYDALDMALRGTLIQVDWLFVGRPLSLNLLQLGLVLSELGMVLGRATAPLFTVMAVVLRVVEVSMFPLNDYYYFIVIGALLAVPGNPLWRRDVLLVQLAWVYACTALLKLNEQWLSGGHLYVRLGYLWGAEGWPHLPALRACSGSLACTAALAKGAVVGELLLSLLLLLRRGRPLAIALVTGIHLFAALALNVWFFGASMIALVAIIFPRRPAGAPVRPAPI